MRAITGQVGVAGKWKHLKRQEDTPTIPALAPVGANSFSASREIEGRWPVRQKQRRSDRSADVLVAADSGVQGLVCAVDTVRDEGPQLRQHHVGFLAELGGVDHQLARVEQLGNQGGQVKPWNLPAGAWLANLPPVLIVTGLIENHPWKAE